MEKQELTLLSINDVQENSRLEVLKNYGLEARITDLAILTGGRHKALSEKEIEGPYWIRDSYFYDGCPSFTNSGYFSVMRPTFRSLNIRPVFKNSPKNIKFRRIDDKGVIETDSGEYPQNAPSKVIQTILEAKFKTDKLSKTGNNYTFDSTGFNNKNSKFNPVTYDEYIYQGRKYIRVMANIDYKYDSVITLSNGETYRNGDYVWVEVSPVTWLIDDKTGLLISKKGLVSGITFLDDNISYDDDFSKTNIKKFFDKYMLKDMFPNELKIMTKPKKDKNIKIAKPYNFNFDKVSEDEIIKGAIESDIAVFLHGPSSEGKTARVREIDPTYEEICLATASIDSLNGKCVYSESTGKISEKKPPWLERLEEKCEKEPDRLHIVFFDELTNAFPSVQGQVFNIVLEKRVNGIWNLPKNARIVAAGNETKDSLAANTMVESLFNRFAHVYIKTTTEGWLKWASEHNIHPAIYTYIAFKNGATLRTKYTGIKPNADPRKWEMASKMLYATGKPEMIRALVGEDITNEFVNFCNQKVITLEYVLKGNCNLNQLYTLNTSEKYATTMGLTRVDDENLEMVRNFVKNLGPEFVAIFDALWTHGDEKRLERLAEAKLAETPGGMKIWQ